MTIDFAFSQYAQKSTRISPVNAMTSFFSKDFREGVDINLGVGYVNDATIPSEELLFCMQEVVKNSQIYKSPLNYGAAAGSVHLHNAIKNFYCQLQIGGIQRDDFATKTILIGSNGATSILDAIADVCPQEGIVITVDPMYYIYTESLERKGFSVVSVSEDENGINIIELEQLLKRIDVNKISFFYIVTVNNPSTVILSNNRKQKVVEIVTSLSLQVGRKIPLILDRAYEDIVYGEHFEKIYSGLLYDTQGVVIEVGTLSKIIAPALRIGYMIMEQTVFSQVIAQKINDVGFSAPLINQEIAACFLEKYGLEHCERVKKGYAAKAQFVKELLEQHLALYMESYSGGIAGFYFYITFKRIETHTHSDFYKFLSRTTGYDYIDGENCKKTRLIYVPGEFFVHANGTNAAIGMRQLRLSFGFEDLDTLKRAILLIVEACEYVYKKENPN